MQLLVSILIIIACLLLTLVVLVQNSKGGGLSSAFASSNQIMGVRKTADFLEKATWALAIALVVLCLASSMTITRGVAKEESLIKDQVTNAAGQLPTIPQQPANQGE